MSTMSNKVYGGNKTSQEMTHLMSAAGVQRHMHVHDIMTLVLQDLQLMIMLACSSDATLNFLQSVGDTIIGAYANTQRPVYTQ